MVDIAPITIGDLADVGAFLHVHLNRRVSAADWIRAVDVPWEADRPNFGFQLRLEDSTLGGVLLAFYSERVIRGRVERICNLGAWCVLPEHRAHSFRMLRAALAQPGYTFTDLSPSGAVVPLDERLGFTRLDTSVQLVPCLPLPTGRTTVVDDSESIEGLLDTEQLRIYRDHRGAAAAHHVVLRREGHNCYVVYRQDRRRNIPAFVSVLYVSDPQRFRLSLNAFGSHVLRRRQGVALLLEERIVGRLFIARHLAGRPKMFKSAAIGPADIDNLYSELTCVAW
ncbi:hypothetical protein [Flexivirga alba]|uniref:N-acetyltransferase domain-containing protein n=1 Tax=Flexivirga alba TaxID=702742 RepID=A0ABW2AFN1_9MICO